MKMKMKIWNLMLLILGCTAFASTAFSRPLIIDNQDKGRATGGRSCMPLKLPLADDGVFDQFCIGELAVKFGTFQVRTRENFDINVPVTPNPCTSGGGFEYNAVLVWQDGEDAIVWATPSSGSNTSYFCASTGGPISAVLNLEVDGGAGKFRCATGSLTIETDFSALVPDELEPLGIPGMLLYSPSPRSSELSPTVIRGVVDVPIQC